MVALRAAVVLALDAIPAHAFADIAGVFVCLVVRHPEQNGLALLLLPTYLFALERGEIDDGVPPHHALRVQPHLLVLEQVLFHDATQVGAERAGDVGGALLQEVPAALALPDLGRLRQLRPVVSLMDAALADLAGYDAVLARLHLIEAGLAAPRRLIINLARTLMYFSSRMMSILLLLCICGNAANYIINPAVGNAPNINK